MRFTLITNHFFNYRAIVRNDHWMQASHNNTDYFFITHLHKQEIRKWFLYRNTKVQIWHVHTLNKVDDCGVMSNPCKMCNNRRHFTIWFAIDSNHYVLFLMSFKFTMDKNIPNQIPKITQVKERYKDQRDSGTLIRIDRLVITNAIKTAHSHHSHLK